jgi:hypothetical protein
MASGAAKVEGDRIAAWLLENWQAFGLKNVIWYEQICTDGKTWKRYEWEPYFRSNPNSSRNPTTHKHGDHVHCQLDKDGLIGTYKAPR